MAFNGCQSFRICVHVVIVFSTLQDKRKVVFRDVHFGYFSLPTTDSYTDY